MIFAGMRKDVARLLSASDVFILSDFNGSLANSSGRGNGGEDYRSLPVEWVGYLK